MPNPMAETGHVAHDIIRYGHRSLDLFFRPRSVAVIGATEKQGSVGRTILWNLMSTPFGGTVFPVNPKRPNVLGIKAYPSVKDVPDRVDLAVIVIPAPSVPKAVAECVQAGVGAAIVISAGFRELGPPGVELENQVFSEARKGNMRIIGPNCLGLMNPRTGLNATFATKAARPGRVGFISQSGALCTAILDWSIREQVGFSAFVSVGSMLDVGWGDLIDHLATDPDTDSIVMYMESIGDAGSFMSAARETALSKPIIVIKAGHTSAAAKAAASHTGTLTGSDQVLDAAFKRCGVLRVDAIEDLFDMAEILAKQPRPKGPRLTILTNAGGPGVLATDALITKGGELAQLSPGTKAEMDKFLPPHWSRNNPIDILGDAGPDRYTKALEIAARDPESDGLLVILTPQAMTDPLKTAEALTAYARLEGKPLLASWMGGPDVAAGVSALNAANIPTFQYPDAAAEAFCYMWRYSLKLRLLYETPALSTAFADGAVDRAGARKMLDDAVKAGRTLLTEAESKQLLASYGIPVIDTRVVRSEEEAVKVAEELGYPVVLKLYSETITHKTDVGGVKLNLESPDEVRGAYATIQSSVKEKVGVEHFLGVTVQPMADPSGYELIVGSSLDPQFGQVLLFGTGGQLVEVFKDNSLALPPLNMNLARWMIEETKISAALKGVRGRDPVDMDALAHILVRFSRLIAEQPRIKELDINPLLASPKQMLALDARVVLHGADVADADLPRMAIRSYPIEYVWRGMKLKDGKTATIRPIRPEDEPLVVQFHQKLSEETMYKRFLGQLSLDERVAHERLVRMCFIDYNREIALVAVRKSEEPGQNEIVGMGRLVRIRNSPNAEFALLVRDDTQNSGVGRLLLSQLVEVARGEGYARLVANILPDMKSMIHLCRKMGFRVEEGAGLPVVRVEYEFS